MESDSELEEEEPELTKPLYLNANITVGAAVAVAMCFARRFKLPGTTLSVLAQLINVFLPSDNLFPKSLYQLKKITSDSSVNVKTHYFCKVYLISVDSNKLSCPNPKCIQNSPSKGTFEKLLFFLEFDIKNQLKSILSRPGMLDKYITELPAAKAPRPIYSIF